jgi:O-antigen/teichoic acid export membrane protein
VLATAVVWSSVLGSLASVGIPQAATYLVGHSKTQRARYASTALMIAGASGAALALVGVTCAFLAVSGERSAPMAIIFAAALPVIVSGAGIGAMLGTGDYNRWGILRLANPAAMLVGVCAVVALGPHTALAVAWATVAAAVFQVCLVVRALATRGLLDAFDTSLAREVLSYGWRNMVSGAAWLVSYRLDQLVLTIVVAPSLLGIYAVAASFGELIVPVAGSAAAVMLSRVAAGGRDEVRRSLPVALITTGVVAGTFGAIVAIGAPEFVRLLFGSQFDPATEPLRILLIGAVALALSTVLADTLRGMNRPLLPAASEVSGAVTMGILLILLLPGHGIKGAAVASTVSYVVVTVGLGASVWWQMHKARPAPEAPPLRPPGVKVGA